MARARRGIERTVPECIVLPARPGATPSGKPPVRIFLGTEPAQFRAERVFIWSIEQVRDPSRVYEIYLMKELAGYRKWFWTTSFTNYRFAVPHYAGGSGRAIYNDEDQIYLADPGELFDLDMREHGYLTISDRDTAVMLIECERMAHVWTLRDAQRRRKHHLLDRGLEAGLCGPLPPEWHARDEEYEPGRSKLLHYTTLHMQPWRPFPERFVYRDHPYGHLWFDLERGVNVAGFQVFTHERPSASWREELAASDPKLDEAVRDLVRRAKATGLLWVTPGASGRELPDPERWEVQRALSCTLPQLLERAVSRTRRDGVVCTGALEQVPTDDIAWVIDELFQRARQFVFAAVPGLPVPRRRWITPPAGTVHTPDWWVEQFDAVAVRYPDVHWELVIRSEATFGGERVELRQGGRFLGDALPRVWVLADHKPGHTTQSLGLAEELGWPFERIDLRFTRVADLPNALLGESLRGLARDSAHALRPPWPDLVIATGRRTSPVARWIRKQSRGRARIVQLGRLGVTPPQAFDLTVVPTYARLLPHPRRIEIAAPLTRVRATRLEEATRRWRPRFENAPHPRIALLMGGNSPHYRFTPEHARELGRAVAAMAESAGGSVFVTTSRRTLEASARALAEALPEAVHAFRWTRDTRADDNPYLGYLALADAFVVSGESASMLAEACATGKPVTIYELPRGVPGWKGLAPRLLDAFVEAVLERAEARPLSRRAITRPQRGMELFCSKLVARGIVRPSCDYRLLHDALVERGAARRFDGSFAEERSPPVSDLPRVAERVRRILGLHES